MVRHLASIAFLSVMTVVLGGCSTVRIADHKSAVFATVERPAVRCVCLWQEGKGQTDSGQTARGFAGQVYFFTASDESPVAVEGDVHIFLFDDHGSPEEQSRPISEAAFANLEWQSMRHESQLGPAYSLFVPYPRADNLEANCALRVRLTRPDGSVLYSDMALIKLLGLPRPEQETKVSVVDPRREQQWAGETSPANESRTTGETIGMRRGDRFMATAIPEGPSRGTEIGKPVLPAEKANPDIDSRVKYYEEKLQTILKERAANQSSQHRPAQYAPGAIEQTGYRQSSDNGAPQQVENPFYSF